MMTLKVFTAKQVDIFSIIWSDTMLTYFPVHKFINEFFSRNRWWKVRHIILLFVIQSFQELTWKIYLNLVKIILTLCHTDVRKRVFASSWVQGNCHAGLRFISLEVGWLIEASISERPATACGDVRPSQSNPTSRNSFCPSTSIK